MSSLESLHLVEELCNCLVLGTVHDQEEDRQLAPYWRIDLVVHLLPHGMATTVYSEHHIDSPHTDGYNHFVLLIKDAAVYETTTGQRFIFIREYWTFPLPSNKTFPVTIGTT